jgi:hypothetical protein
MAESKPTWSGKELLEAIAPNSAEWTAAQAMVSDVRKAFEAQALADPEIRYSKVTAIVALELLHEVLGLPPEMWK